MAGLPNTVKLKRTFTPNNVPTTSTITAGELALNLNDGKLFSVIAPGGITTGVIDIVAHGIAGTTTTLTGAVTGSGITGNTITTTLSAIGTPGTYNLVTTDSSGRVSSGANVAMPIALGGTGLSSVGADGTVLTSYAGTAVWNAPAPSGNVYSAGTGITIVANVIAVDTTVVTTANIGANGTVLTSNGTSASWQTISTGTTYSAGTGLTLTGNVFAIDSSVLTTSSSIADSQLSSNIALVSQITSNVSAINSNITTINSEITSINANVDLKANIASPTFTGTVSGITASMVGAPSGSGTSTGTNTGDQTITLTGDLTGSGASSFSTTLATVNSDVGSFGNSTTVPTITVNAKGLITAVSTSTISASSGNISVTGGDLTLSGMTGTAITNATLATVNSNVGTFGDGYDVPVITVNAKGLITAISTQPVSGGGGGMSPQQVMARISLRV